MKKIILIGALVGLLAGCAEDYSVTSKSVENIGDKALTVYHVNGKPLDCVGIGNYRLSCNWEKHNKLFEEGISQ